MPEPAPEPRQGVGLEWLQRRCARWAEDYDWRVTERRLNAVPQFTTTIDGLAIHFLHARSPHRDAFPLVLTHGWPGITAVTAVDALDLKEGDVLLVAGATAGVGSLAVQLAAKAGATVVAPARPDDEEFLRGLGVSEIVPRDGDVAAAVRERLPDGVDALLDLVNYAPGTYDAALKDGARIASPTGAAGEGPGRTMVMAAPTTENLQRLGRLLADGTLRVPVQATYALEQAPEALDALTSQHTQGKLAIEVR